MLQKGSDFYALFKYYLGCNFNWGGQRGMKLVWGGSPWLAACFNV